MADNVNVAPNQSSGVASVAIVILVLLALLAGGWLLLGGMGHGDGPDLDVNITEHK